MALIGLIRIGKDPDDVKSQREALEPICSHTFEEVASRRRLLKNRPQLLAAVAQRTSDDILVVTRARNLGPSMVHGLEVLLDLVDSGVAVKVLGGVGAGEHTAHSHLLDDVRELTQLRREFESSRIRRGIKRAQEHGVANGRPRTISDDTRIDIKKRRTQGESIRAIADAVGVSTGSVHRVLAAPTEAGDASGR